MADEYEAFARTRTCLRNYFSFSSAKLSVTAEKQEVQQKVRLSTLVLVTIATFDLVSTLAWMNSGQLEGNPLFAWLARFGSIPFVLGKLVFLLLPIAVIEWARKQRPVTAEIGTWVAAALYGFLWARHVLELGQIL